MKTALRLGSGFALLLILFVAAVWLRRGGPDEVAGPRTAPLVEPERPASAPDARKTAVDRIPRRPGFHQEIPGDRPSAPEEIVRIPLGAPPDGSVADGTVSALEDTVKRQGESYAYNSRHYGATFSKEGPDVLFERPADGLGHPTFAYRLQEVRLGTRVLASAGPAGAYLDPSERAVAYDRGAVEERYVLNADSLEQVFVLWSLPDDRGDLTVSGRVSTNAAAPAEGTSARLSFTHEGREVVFVSDALVFDAAGRRLALDLTWKGGELSMTVPAEWMAEAVAPVVVDPLIGNPLTVDAGASQIIQTVNTHKVRVVDVAHGSAANQYLVVWHERNGSSAFNYDVFGQRVSATGTLVGTPIAIATTTAGEYECAVAYAPSVNRFLVTWRHDPADNASAADQRIQARVVNPDGTFHTAAFTAADKTGQDFGPSIAFDGTQWFVAYTNVVSSTDSNVCGRFVSTAGGPGTAVDIDAATDYAALPSVSFANGVYLAAWEKGTTTSRGVSCRKMTTTGTFPAGIASVEPSANTPSEPDVAGGTNRFIVTWRRTSNNDVKARLVTADASTTTAFPVAAFNLRTGNTARETPRAAWAGTPGQWYVAYADAATTATDVYGVRVSSAGAVSPVDQLTNASSKEWRPELAYNAAANEALVVYLNNASAPYQVVCRRWSFGAGPQAPATLTAAPGAGQITVSWSAVAGATSFKVKRSNTWGGPYTVVASNVIAFSYVDGGLTGGHIRYYIVSSVGSAGEGPDSAPVSAAPLTAPLAPGVSSTALSTTSIRWAWSDLSNETGYEILDAQDAVVATAPANTTSWTETNLVENTRYQRKVRAVNAVGPGAASATMARYTLVRDASPAHATSLATPGFVDLSIARPPNHDKDYTGCQVYVFNYGTWAWDLVKAMDSRYLARDTFPAGSPYREYIFIYRNGDGISNAAYSASFLVNVPSTWALPPAPKNLAATAAAGSATLTWDPSPGAASFKVKRAASSTGPWTVIAQNLAPNTAQNSYVNTGLTNLTTYYYVVTAVNTAGESGPSNQASVTPGAPTVTVEVPDPSASEAAGNPGQFLIRRTGDTSFSLQVFFTVSGTAMPGSDYTALPASVTMAAGVATATLNVAPVEDAAYETAETVYLLLSPGPKYVLGTPASQTVTIADNEAPAPPSNVRTKAYHQTIDVEWDPSTSQELAGYNVYRKTGAAGTWSLRNTTGVVIGTKYRDTGVTNGTVYFYHVKAVRK